MIRFTIDRYILKSHIGPYLFGFSIITFIFVMDFIFRYLDLFIGKGVNFFTVLEFFTLSLGHMFALIIPMAVMPATLMAFGQLASDNEITAMKANGISLYRMILPVAAASILLAAALVFYNNRILPESNHRLMNLMIDIGKMKPTIEIKENIFSEAVKGYTILVREKNDKTGEIKDVQIFKKSSGGIPTTIVAAGGKMTFVEDDNILRFELENGEIHEMPDPGDMTTYRRTSFKQYTLNIQDTDKKLKRTERSHRGDREMSAAMMRAKIADIRKNIASLKMHMHRVAAKPIDDALSSAAPGTGAGPVVGPAPGEKPRLEESREAIRQTEQILQILDNDGHIIESNRSQISRYGVEIHKKYSIPFSCILFVLLGAPLAIRSGRKGMTVSVGFSILLYLIYYVFLISGEKMADRRLVSPWLAMWLPNIVLSAGAVILLHRTVQESQTINWSRLNLLKRLRSNKS